MINIKKYKKQIEILEPLKEGVIYQPSKWEKHFENKDDLSCAVHFSGKLINRKTVIEEFRKYYIKKTADFKTPFLFTMIWGYDSNYGPHRTNEIMTVSKNLYLIKESLEAVNRKDVDEAFSQLKKVKGLGISYLSKILYFAGKAKGLDNYPLIFDIRVASALVSLASDGLLDGYLKIFPSEKLESYNCYNNLLHKWANDLQVEADQIEFFLFEQKF
jgi:hypothetical protein